MKTKKLISVICALSMAGSIMSGAVIANAAEGDDTSTDVEVTATEAATEEATEEPTEAPALTDGLTKVFDMADYYPNVPTGWTAPSGYSLDNDTYHFFGIPGGLVMSGYGAGADTIAVEFTMANNSDGDNMFKDLEGKNIIGYAYTNNLWVGHGDRTYDDSGRDKYNIPRLRNYLKTVIGTVTDESKAATGYYNHNQLDTCTIIINNENGTVEDVMYNATADGAYTGDYYTVMTYVNDTLLSTEYYTGNVNGLGGIHTTRRQYFGNLKIYVDKQETVEKTYKAQIGDVQYETLERAIDAAATGAEIKLLTDDVKFSKSMKAVTIDGDGHTIDVPNAITVWNTFNSLTIKNAILTGGRGHNFADDNATVFDNVTINGFEGDCLFLNGATIKNSNINGYNGVAVIANNKGDGYDILIEKSTITNTISKNLNIAVRVNGDLDAVIDDSTITGTVDVNGNALNDVSVNSGTLTLKNNTVIGKLADNGGDIVLDSTFKGDVTIVTSTAVGTVVATVNEGADVTNVDVDGLAEENELKVIDNELVIIKSPVLSANLIEAVWTSTSDEYTAAGNVLTRVSDSKSVYGYKSTLTNDGVARTATATVYDTEANMSEKTCSTSFSGYGDVVFYVISAKALDTATSTVVLN